MVQNVTVSAPNKYGSVNKIGTTENGRVVYQVIDPQGNLAGNMSVAANQADIFEKSYQDLMKSAPKLEEFSKKMTPAKIEKRQRTAKWITGLSALVGGGIPAIMVKGEGPKGTWKQIGLTALGTIAGLVIGRFIAVKTTTPPGAVEFAKATETISKLDIQPV